MEKAGKVKGNKEDHGKRKKGGPKRKPGRPRKNPLPPTPPPIEEPDFSEPTDSLPAWDLGEEQETGYQEFPAENLEIDQELEMLSKKYYELLDDNPQLRLLDDFVEVDPSVAGVAGMKKEIFRLSTIVNSPFWSFVYSKIWDTCTEIFEKGLQTLPMVGPRFSTVPTQECPRPVSIARALQGEEVFKEVVPVFDEIRENVPFLNSLSGFVDPKYRLAFSISMAVTEVYKHNAPKEPSELPL